MAYRLEELRNAKTLQKELNERASRYTHFELKNITINENKLWKYSNKRRTVAASLIRRRCVLTFPLHVRRLIEGGAYSSNYGNLLYSQLFSDFLIYSAYFLACFFFIFPLFCLLTSPPLPLKLYCQPTASYKHYLISLSATDKRVDLPNFLFNYLFLSPRVSLFE